MHLDAWLAGGDRVPLTVASGTHHLFRRIEGDTADAPWTTFLHGFPTSSHDWHKVAAHLPPGRRRLFVDHLGFGDSDKPRRHHYGFQEQLDLLLALWRREGIYETILVAHDYSVSIAQEILWRIVRGRWDGPRITAFALLNGGLFWSRQQRLPVQMALKTPVVGPLVARGMSYRRFADTMRGISHPDHVPSQSELQELWAAVERRRGRSVISQVSRYHGERRRREQEWRAGMAHCLIPVRLLWGMADPVSGAPMVEEVRRHMPACRVVPWEDVGHYPQLEVPDRIAAEIDEMERRPMLRSDMTPTH